MTAIPRTPTAAEPTRSLLSRWGDRSVTFKVLTAVSVTAAVAGGIGALGISGMSAAADDADRLYSDNLQGAVQAAAMDQLLSDMRVTARDALIVATPEETLDKLAAVEGYVADFHEALDAYAAGTTQPAKLAMVEEMTADIDEYLAVQTGVLAPLAIAGDVRGWVATNAEEAGPIGDELAGDLQELRDMEMAQAEAAATEVRDAFESNRTLTLVVMAAGIALALALGWFVAGGVARAARRVQDVTEALAKGDLTRTSGLESKDEMGRMGQALDEAVVNLRSVMATVVSSADAVAASSEELSASSAQISAGAEETAAQSG
ncbi:methyl-accepting chemotaxis protein, partial [Blastococcus sp. DSM 46786]|uniref:Tar ligand binding domain-containing protein n=1 Tax=Blastococcus sp. DSM 46786 TaxID=1798227 RepID=UPI0008D3648C